jgi:hypothetical protein
VRIPARWLLCGLLFLATLLNYLDRQTISATAIADEMGIKDDVVTWRLRN